MMLDPTLVAAQQQASAAWLQAYAAIGQGALTVIAIGIAIGVPLWQQKLANRQVARAQVLQSREIAIVVWQAVLGWRDQVAKLAQFARARRTADVTDHLIAACAVPPELQAQIGRLHLLGDVGLPLQAAVHLARNIRKSASVYREAARGDERDDTAEFVLKQTHDAIFRLKALLVVSEQALSSLFHKGEHPAIQEGYKNFWYEQDVKSMMRNDHAAYNAAGHPE